MRERKKNRGLPHALRTGDQKCDKRLYRTQAKELEHPRSQEESLKNPRQGTLFILICIIERSLQK